MSITDWLPEDRPREKLLAHGAKHLTDGELLAIFLRVGMVGKSAVDLAHELIAHFGSLSALFNANLTQLTDIKGMGEAKYVQLQAVLEMSRRALADGLARAPAFNDLSALKTFVQLQFPDGQTTETIVVLFLTPQLHLIAVEPLVTGELTRVNLPTRALVSRAIALNAHGIILAHNHPMGIAAPSIDDIESTQMLQKYLRPLDVHVFDHIVVADGQDAFSMAENGLMQPLT